MTTLNVTFLNNSEPLIAQLFYCNTFELGLPNILHFILKCFVKRYVYAFVYFSQFTEPCCFF